MNPVMPLRSELPLRYLQGLKAYVRQKRRKAEEKQDGQGIDRADSWDIWVGQMIKQYKEGTKTNESDRKALRQSSSSKGQNDKQDTVKVHPPHLTPTGGPATGSHKALLRQGPVIFSPAPQEAEDDYDESYASDIAILSVPTGDEDEEADSAREEIRVVSIAWSSSRVDIGLYPTTAPVWVENNVSIFEFVSSTGN
jgi:nucleoporin NUP82